MYCIEPKYLISLLCTHQLVVLPNGLLLPLYIETCDNDKHVLCKCVFVCTVSVYVSHFTIAPINIIVTLFWVVMIQNLFNASISLNNLVKHHTKYCQELLIISTGRPTCYNQCYHTK